MGTRDIVRGTRISSRTDEILNAVAQDLGIKRAAVDRQILEWMAGAINDHRKPGESLSYFFWKIFEQRQR